MEMNKYGKGKKGVLIGINIVCTSILCISILVGMCMLFTTNGHLSDIMDRKPYEQSDALHSKVSNIVSEAWHYAWMSEQLATNGELDGEKQIDIFEYSEEDYQRAQETKPLTYSLRDLMNWANGSNLAQFQSEYGSDSYIYGSEYDDYEYKYSEDVYTEEELNEIKENGVCAGSDGKICVLNVGYGEILNFVEIAAPTGYNSLKEYSDENQIPFDVCFRALYDTLGSLPQATSDYNEMKQRLQTNNTNIRYIIEKDGAIAGGNMTAEEEANEFYTEILEYTRGPYVVRAYLDTDYPANDSVATEAKIYTSFYTGLWWIIAGLIIGIIGSLVSLIALTMISGHVDNQEGIVLNWLDKPKTELAVVAWGIIGAAVCSIMIMACLEFGYEEYSIGMLVIIVMMSVITASLALTGYLSLVRRIKAKTIGSNSICHILKKGVKTIIQGTKISSRLIAFFGVYFLAMLICVWLGGFGFFLAIVLNIFVGVFLTKDAISRQKIMEGLQRIAEGELDYKIDVCEVNNLNVDMADAVNQVGGGLEAAVEQSIKNERMKTDLITNVSHDIKTPLTSIINYVDLLKREDIENENAKGYIEILDQKSQRLKQLTEDLVEASKISSGNVTLELTRIDFNEILQQALGEFSEKFLNKNLNVIVSGSESPAVIEADGRRIWRIIENLFQNVVKYAMPGSRVYVNLEAQQRKMIFTVKNISENPLNISVDMLTERFMRGEVSRTTEGSGLGLSIAKSLTEIQKGQFDIYLDGDLFKVTVTFGLID